MTLRRPLLVLVALAGLPGGLHAQADSARLGPLVLSRHWPTHQWRYVGTWTLFLTRDDGREAPAVRVDIRPDSVPSLVEQLQLNHICYGCLIADVPAAWHTLGVPSPQGRFRFGIDSAGALHGAIGVSVTGLHEGPYALLDGQNEGGVLTGLWQAPLPGDSTAYGRFRLVPVRTASPSKAPPN